MALLQFFKKNLIFNSLFLLPYAFILHLGAWLKRIEISNTEQNWIYQKTIGALKLSYETNIVISTVFVFILALIINNITRRYKLNSDGQLFPGVVFILFTGLSVDFLYLNPALISSLFILIAIDQSFAIYNSKYPGGKLFNVGFLIGITSLFYLPNFYLLIYGVMAIIILKGFTIKYLFQLLFGFINSYFLCFVVCYLFNTHSEFYKIQIGQWFSPYILHIFNRDSAWISLSILLVYMLWCLVQFDFFQTKRVVLIQKYYSLFFWCCLVSFISLLFMKINHHYHLMILIVPLGFLVGLLLTKIKNQLLAETLHLFMVVLALFLQFQNW